MRQHPREEREPDPATVMRRGDSELVDPELRRFVRVHVMDGGHHPDDDVILHGNDEMMPGISHELPHPAFVHGTVEHIECHVLENRGVGGCNEEDFRLRGHDVTPYFV